MSGSGAARSFHHRAQRGGWDGLTLTSGAGGVSTGRVPGRCRLAYVDGPPQCCRSSFEPHGRLRLDFSIVYSTMGSDHPHPNDELRPVLCRALNTMAADITATRGSHDPVATIRRTHRKRRSTSSIRVRTLGFKAVMITSNVRRKSRPPLTAPGWTRSAWRARTTTIPFGEMRRVEGRGHLTRGQRRIRQPCVFVHVYSNHSQFRGAGEALRKRWFERRDKRFPNLNFAFLKGVAWASELYAASSDTAGSATRP